MASISMLAREEEERLNEALKSESAKIEETIKTLNKEIGSLDMEIWRQGLPGGKPIQYYSGKDGIIPIKEYPSNTTYYVPPSRMEFASDGLNSIMSQQNIKSEVKVVNGQFIVKDSGKRESFEGGAVRDTQENKPRFDLIPPLALKRVANLYAAGAKKYDENNWRKSMPFSRIYASLLRHVYAFGEGDTSEDHLAACVFNCLAIMHFQEMGREDLDDMFKDAVVAKEAKVKL